ncbi:hypothetical protein, partial [Aeromonas hydrophila]|uniref:hypothetical protein n=1 Tax=Aeromonas hydrophila TaxID=644 RepID=UPI0038D185C5
MLNSLTLLFKLPNAVVVALFDRSTPLCNASNERCSSLHNVPQLTSALVQAVCNSFKESACCCNRCSKAAVCRWCAASIRSNLSINIRSSSVIQFTSTAILPLFVSNGSPMLGAR